MSFERVKPEPERAPTVLEHVEGALYREEAVRLLLLSQPCTSTRGAFSTAPKFTGRNEFSKYIALLNETETR